MNKHDAEREALIAHLTIWLREHADRFPSYLSKIARLPSFSKDKLDLLAQIYALMDRLDSLTDAEREQIIERIDDTLSRASEAATRPLASSMPITDDEELLAAVAGWCENPTTSTVEEAVAKARKPKH
jgi:hypothetical protein